MRAWERCAQVAVGQRSSLSTSYTPLSVCSSGEWCRRGQPAPSPPALSSSSSNSPKHPLLTMFAAFRTPMPRTAARPALAARVAVPQARLYHEKVRCRPFLITRPSRALTLASDAGYRPLRAPQECKASFCANLNRIGGVAAARGINQTGRVAAGR